MKCSRESLLKKLSHRVILLEQKLGTKKKELFNKSIAAESKTKKIEK